MKTLVLKRFLLLILIVLVIAAGSYYFFLGVPWKAIAYKKEFKTYLDNKYDNEFVIEGISFNFFHGTYHSYAHLKKGPEVRFHVGQDMNTKEVVDAYYYETWKHQANEELIPIVKKIYSNSLDHSIAVQSANDSYFEDHSHVPDYKDLAFVRIKINMRNIVITDDNKLSEIKRAFQLLESLKEKGVKLHNFGIDYDNKTLQLQFDKVEQVDAYTDLEEWFLDYKK